MLSVVLAVVKAVMYLGHSDLRLFLSLDLSALFSNASAPLTCPLLPHVIFVWILCVCV